MPDNHPISPKAPSLLSPVQDHHCRVIAQRNCGPNLWVITLESTSGRFACRAGQFVMLDLPERRFFFRRPFSVLKVSGEHRFEILYKVVGQGTEMMKGFQIGQSLNVLGPLGKPFPKMPDAEAGKYLLLLGGGIGIAPLACWLAENQELAETQEKKHETTAANHLTPLCVFGARNASELSIRPELEAYLDLTQRVFATDDGSYTGPDGFSGRIDQWLLKQPEYANNAAAAYICGPMPMMRACVLALKQLNPLLSVFVSLENNMPCGTGVCSGCAVFSSDSLPIKVCVEGPVLNAERIDWENADGRQDIQIRCTLSESATPDAYTSPLEISNAESQEGFSCQR